MIAAALSADAGGGKQGGAGLDALLGARGVQRELDTGARSRRRNRRGACRRPSRKNWSTHADWLRSRTLTQRRTCRPWDVALDRVADWDRPR